MRPINANFTRLFYGLAISAVGNYVFDTTLILWITTKVLPGKTYAPAAVSGVLVAMTLAIILVAPIAGVFVDRWDKRRTMMGSDLIRAALVGVLVVLALLPEGALPVGVVLFTVYIVVFASTGVANFFAPANFTLIGDIVDGDAARAKAASLNQAASSAAAIVGPPLAAPLLFSAGVVWALVINAVSFLVSFAMVRGVKIESTPAAASTNASGSFLREFAEGLRFVGRTPAMRIMLIVLTVVALGSAAMNSLGVFFVTENLHADAGLYGLLGMGEGVGAIAGTIAAAWVCRKLGDVRVFSLGIILIGVGILAYSRLTNIYAAIVVLVLLSLPLGSLNVSMTPILLRVVPRELLGRAVSVIGPIQQLAGMFSVLAAGWLVSTVLLGFHATVAGITWGRVDTVFFAAGLFTIIGGVYAIGLRSAVPAPALGVQPEPEPEPA